MASGESFARALGMVPLEKLPIIANCRGNNSCFHVTDAVPSLQGFYFAFEKDYDVVPGSIFAKANNWLPVTCVIVYGIFIAWGQSWMKDRKPFDLRWMLAAWNLFLSVFSFCGMIRTWPHVAYNLTIFGLEETLCQPAVYMYGCGPTGLWVQLFIFSKMPELIDTFFIVVRKKQLVFLHWYHHITVLLFCWHSYVTESPGGIYFCAMNYAVHALMYFYYFLMAVRMLPKWFPAGVVTIAQISQMVVGVALTVQSGMLYYNPSRTCNVKVDNLLAGGLMYFSYFLLFVHFAVDRYFLKPKRKGAASSGKKVD